MGLALIEDGTKLRGATRSGKIGEMTWQNRETGEVWNFLREHDGKLEGDQSSLRISRKAKAWDERGFADLGFLSAMVFSDNMFNKAPRPSRASKGVKDSFLEHLFRGIMVYHRRVDLESSLCFCTLREFMKNPDLSTRPKRSSHRFVEPKEVFQEQLGGWIKIKEKGELVELTRNPERYLTMTQVFVDLTNEEINDLRLENCRGNTPQNPVGYDLLPSANTRPSPLVTDKIVIPMDMDDSIKVVEFANATQGRYTASYVKSAPATRLVRGQDPQILIMKSLKPRLHILNLSWR